MHFVYSLTGFYMVGYSFCPGPLFVYMVGYSFCPGPLFVALTLFLYMSCILSGCLTGFFLFNISILFIHKKKWWLEHGTNCIFFSPPSVLAFIGFKKKTSILYSRCMYSGHSYYCSTIELCVYIAVLTRAYLKKQFSIFKNQITWPNRLLSI